MPGGALLRNRDLARTLAEPFCSKLQQKRQFWLPFDGDMAIETVSLNNALRAAASGRKWATLVGSEHQQIRAKLGFQADGQATVTLARKGFTFADADLLSGTRQKRLNALRRAFAARPLMQKEEDAWLAIGAARAFSDREYVELMTALGSTPEGLRDQFRKPEGLNVETLMPDEPAYYDRLIAPLSEASDFTTFINGDLAAVRLALFQRHPKRAVRRLGFAALWQPLIPFELLSHVSTSDISALLAAEDPFSLLFGFELCRHFVAGSPGLVDLGASFLKKLLNDGKRGSQRCTRFSALALITMVTLRRSAKAPLAPLYWVRLAALAHAGVLTDALSRLPNPAKFLAWSAKNFYPSYMWHGIIDRRVAPRWNPDWIDPDHLYTELVGRVQNAVQTMPPDICPMQWSSVIKIAVDRLQEAGRAIAAAFPGPFDDFQQIVPPQSIPAFTEVEDALEKASALSDVPELLAVVNLIPPSNSIAASVQRILNLPLDEPITKDQSELHAFRLCAQIARATRSIPIGHAVINRCFARLNTTGYAATDLFAVMAEACAAHEDHEKYAELLGRTAANICFAVNDSATLSQLESVFRVFELCDERLGPSLGRAKAIVRLKSGQP
jgi:hypothetical protein